ncbi:MAG: cell division protein FtsZ [Rickettsiales endosymbiont of Dermacentor nuttalli]
MSINLRLPENAILKPSIIVFGAGGAGGNAVNNMISANLEGVKFVTANTDAQALEYSLAENRIQLGETITRGLGAGASPEVGRAAAEEAAELIIENLQGSNMLFITAGMGGGTGTGAAPVIARIAREYGILTVGVVTKPFHFEGAHRMKLAELGLLELQKYVDTLIVIPNQNLFRLANEKTTFADAFRMADEVLHAGVRGITDLMIMPGLINLDFADIRAVMSEMGKAMMGTGEAEGEERAIKAAEAAIANPLLDNCSMKGAKGVLINITGGLDMTLFEVDAAANRIRDEVDAEEANIIFGSTFNPLLEGRIRVSVVATGIDAHSHTENDKYYLLKDMVDNNVNNISTNKVPNTELYDNTIVENEQDEEEIFVSPRAVEPKVSYDIPNTEHPKKAEQYNTRYNTASSHLKANGRGVEKGARLGLFGRMANSVGLRTNQEEQNNRTYEREEELVAADGLGEDVFEIPAFLRRKNTNK